MTSRRELAWQTDALCAQVATEMFFVEKGGSSRNARRVCAGCTVVADCLAYAQRERIQFGIFGGLTPRQRGITTEGEVAA